MWKNMRGTIHALGHNTHTQPPHMAHINKHDIYIYSAQQRNYSYNHRGE